MYCKAIASTMSADRRQQRPVLPRGFVVGLLTIAFASQCHAGEPLATPLEMVEYSRLSTSAEISAYLAALARGYPIARVERIGTSVNGRPLEALVLSGEPNADVSTADRLTIEIVGAQHGMEGAGSEALLFLARDLVAGRLRHVLDDVDVVLVPNANPDGREFDKRLNANSININVDYVALTQPESRALVSALARYEPEVALDLHESAVLKKHSLAREGYMTDFTAQFEIANHPSIAPSLRAFALQEVLIPWIAGVNAAGLHSNRYIGEIRSSRQPVTNGGLTLRNFRNRVGIEGKLSFLIETRLDPRAGDYPTYRNIRERVAKQQISLERFLTVMHGKQAKALAAVATARREGRITPLVLDPQYVGDRGDPPVALDLRRISDGELERIEFADHRTVAAGPALPMPAAYLIRRHQIEFGALFDQQGIAYRTLDSDRTDWAVEFEAESTARLNDVHESVAKVRARPGDLWVDVDQPRGRLAVLLLEPRSTSSLFQTLEFARQIEANHTLPVVRIPR
jgi:hypothetical protein